MAYLGKVDMNDANIKHYSLTGSTLTTVNIGWVPASEQSLRVTINGVVQQGGTFSLSGSNLTLGGALVATDDLEVVGIQSVGNIITPADDSVSTAKLADDAVTTAKILDDNVTLAKMASGTDGNLITYDASGDPAHVATGSATHVLTSNGAGAAPTFQAAASYSPSPVCFIYANSDQTGVSDATWTKATNMAGVFINEDTAYDTSTQTFTVPVGKAGKYYVEATCVPGSGAVSVMYAVGVAIYLNTAVKRLGSFNMSNSAGHKMTAYVSAILDLAEGDDLEVYGYGDMSSGTPAFYQGITSGGTFLCWRLSA